MLSNPELLCKKVREEAGELCQTLEQDEGRERAASEAADLFYHAMVLLNAQVGLAGMHVCRLPRVQLRKGKAYWPSVWPSAPRPCPQDVVAVGCTVYHEHLPRMLAPVPAFSSLAGFWFRSRAGRVAGGGQQGAAVAVWNLWHRGEGGAPAQVRGMSIRPAAACDTSSCNCSSSVCVYDS